MKSYFLNGGMIGPLLDFGTTGQYVIGTTQQRDFINYVGGRTQTSSSTNAITVSLTGLTGGLATAPEPDDFVLVVRCWASNQVRSPSTSSTGWGVLAEIFGDSTNDTNLEIYWKFMGTTPDTSITLNAHTTGNDSSTIIVYVFRGVDLTTPFDVTSTTATTTTTVLPNPPAITPTTTNSIIVVAAGGSHTNSGGTVRTYTAGYLTNFLTVGRDSTYDAIAGIGWLTWTSGAYDPAAWTWGGTDGTGFSSASRTIALRARLINVPIFGNAQNSGMWNLKAHFNYIRSQYTPPGQVLFTTTGTQTWIVPPGITSISAVCIGGGGGGAGGESGRNEGVNGGAGGGLSYGTIDVTPGEALIIVVGAGGAGGGTGNDGNAGGNSSIARGAEILLQGGGGQGGLERTTGTRTGGTSTGSKRQGGGAGGNSGGNSTDTGSGGGGAGGYSGAGGAGGTTGAGSAGTDGGGGGGATNAGQGYGGGGAGIFGSGVGGSTGGPFNGPTGGVGAVGGATGTRPNGGNYGGGGGGCDDDTNSAGGNGGQGVVRIIWGPGRSYPGTGTGDVL
jgi:hypothetical protein